MNNKCIILFSGYNPRAIIAFIRTLENRKVNFAIIAKSIEDDILLTSYKKFVYCIRKSEQLNIDDIMECMEIIQEKVGAEDYIISPSTEALNRFLLLNRTTFEKNKCIVPIVDRTTYELISDKYSFGRLCSQYDIKVPRELDISEIDFDKPIVAKPKKYYSINKNKTLNPIIVKSHQDFEAFLENNLAGDFYFQEFIDGKSIYLLYYFHRNGTVYKFSQENLVQQAEGKSMISAKSAKYHEQTEFEKYIKMFKDISYWGFVMVEVKQDDDSNYMIEANPRFWGPSQLFVDSKKNFFEVFLHDFKLVDTIDNYTNEYEEIRYFWYGGFINEMVNGNNLTYHNYNNIQFSSELPEWLKFDIYRRDDTLEIFIKETGI